MNAYLRPLVAMGILLFSTIAPSVPARPSETMSNGSGEGLRLIAEIPLRSGSHMETTTIKGRDYAFVSEIAGGSESLQIIDITKPERPRLAASLPCNGNQGNVQVSHDKRTLVIGIDVRSQTGCMPGAMGFVTVDISNPTRPRTIGYAEIVKGSHSLAAHPTKPYVYNGEGYPEAPGEMQVWSIKNPARPKLITKLDTGIHSPHDLAFNRSGSMMATANAFDLHLLDTRDPTRPRIVHTTQCPGCLHTHEARFTPDGKRLIVNDEHPANVCPGGALYFYDITKTSSGYGLDLSGTYTADDVGTNANHEIVTKCTPHIFDISADGKRMAATWHEGGIKYLDIRSTTGLTVGTSAVIPGGAKELAWYVNRNGYAFSAKLHKGPYIYVVDSNIGFQVFKITKR